MNPNLGDDRDPVLAWHDAFVAAGIDLECFRFVDTALIEAVWRSDYGRTRVTAQPLDAKTGTAVAVIPSAARLASVIGRTHRLGKQRVSDAIIFSCVPVKATAADSLGHREWVLVGYERSFDVVDQMARKRYGDDCEPKPVPWFYVQVAPRTIASDPQKFVEMYTRMPRFLVENPQAISVNTASHEPANPWHAAMQFAILDTLNWLRSPWRSGM